MDPQPTPAPAAASTSGLNGPSEPTPPPVAPPIPPPPPPTAPPAAAPPPPPAGPSSSRTLRTRGAAKHPVPLEGEALERAVGEKKAALLEEKQRALEETALAHDGLLRELFHLEKFVSLVHYDPQAAKQDQSEVFLAWKQPYDLLTKLPGSGASSGPTPRTTRRAMNDLKGALSLDKGKAPAVATPTPAKRPRPSAPSSSSMPMLPPSEVPRRAVNGHQRTPAAASTSTASSSATPVRRPSKKKASEVDVSSASWSSSPPKRSHKKQQPDYTASPAVSSPLAGPSKPSKKRPSDPTPSPPIFKRIKLIHRIPPPVYTHPDQRPPSPRFGKSLTAFLESYISLEEADGDVPRKQVEERIAADAGFRRRIRAMRAQGRMSLPTRTSLPSDPSSSSEATAAATPAKPNVNLASIKPHRDPPVEPAHHTHLVAHGVQFSALLRAESKARVATTKKISRMVLAHFERAKGADERARKEEEKRMRALAKWTVREVGRKWKLAVDVIRARRKAIERKELDRRQAAHLDAILEQSHQMLTAQQADLHHRRSRSQSESSSPSRARTRSRSASFASYETDAPSVEEDEGQSEDEVVEEAGASDSEGASRAMSASAAASDAEEELEEGDADIVDAALVHDGPSSSPAVAQRVNGYAPPSPSPSFTTPHRNGEPSTLPESASPSAASTPAPPSAPVFTPSKLPPRRSRSRRASSTSRTSLASAPDPDAGDVEFPAHALADETADDLRYDAEMDEDDGESDDSELDGLNEDAELSIEELMAKYGYGPREGAEEDEGKEEEEEERVDEYGESVAPEPVERAKEVVEPPIAPDPQRLEVEPPPHPQYDGDDSDDDLLLLPTRPAARPSVHHPLAPLSPASIVPDSAPNSPAPQPSLDFSVPDSTEGTPPPSPSPSRSPSPEAPGATSTDLILRSPSKLGVERAEASPAGDAGEDDMNVDDAASVRSGSRSSSESGGESSGRLRQPFLLRGQLREYQQTGFEWLVSLYHNGTNGILADEMGLGKTIQTIALFAHLACEGGSWGPHLVIVPTSVMLNWEMEFKKFLPGFKVLTYYGNIKERKAKRVGWNTENSFNVCITSYQLVLADQHIFRRKAWHYMVLDEAHQIKNFRSARWQTLLGFNSKKRLLLTGTPLQNDLSELWALLYFLMPAGGLTQNLEGSGFANHKEFSDWFGSIESGKAVQSGEAMDEEMRATVTKLHTLLRPYLLRRLKKDVEQQMPAKVEHVVYCRLSKRQRFLYDEYMARAQTRETLASGNFMSIINVMMQLRRVCNHPDLFEVRPIVTSFSMSRSVVADFEIKELLVRRRLLAGDSHERLDLHELNLVPAFHERVSTIVSRELATLDASDLLPFVKQARPAPEDVPPPDYRTIAGYKRHRAFQMHLAEVARWKQIARTNSCRCSRSPIYGAGLLSRVEQLSGPKIVPLDVAERDRRGYLDRSDLVSAAVKSYAQRAEDIREVVDTYAFCTPSAVAHDLAQAALPGLDPEEHPVLHDQAFDTLHPSTVKHQIAFPDASLIQYDCGKLQELDALLKTFKEGGHRVLIFTQMTRVLDVLEIFLNHHGHRYLRLDGATKVEQRQILTERFNTDPRILAFILSSRAGGVGINLTGADRVVFYDSDWNPAMDRQCQDRCHRIGQTRDVHIYRFVSSHTIEENMLRKANQKANLDNIVIQEGDYTTDFLQRFDWRDMLGVDGPADDASITDVDTPRPVESAAAIERALANAEDEDDAAAAVIARGEMTYELDEADFAEGDPAAAAAAAAGTPAAADDTTASTPAAGREDGAPPPAAAAAGVAAAAPVLDEDEDEDDGSVDDFMLRFVEMYWDVMGL